MSLRPSWPPRWIQCAVLLAPALLFLTSCGGKKGKATEPVEQIYQQALVKLEKKKYYAARALLQSLKTRLPQDDQKLLPLVHLKLGDSFYLDGGILNLGEALGIYKTFLTYYAQREEIAYVQYQVGMCYFGQVLAPDRDQDLTYRAITEFGKLERLYPDSPYADEARARILECREELAEHEFLIGEFYFKGEHYLAAADRFRLILDDYPHYDRTEEVLFLLGKCLRATANPDEAQLYFERLLHDFPDGKFARDTRKLLKNDEKG